MTARDIIVGAAVEVVFVAIALGILYRIWGFFFGLPKRQIVLPFQRGVRLRKGSIHTVLPPGMYWTTPDRPILLCDMRPSPFRLEKFITDSADGTRLLVTLLGDHRVADPATAVMATTNLSSAFFLVLQ